MSMRLRGYRIWNKGILVRAFCRRPKNVKVVPLSPRTIDEAKRGIRYIEVTGGVR